MAQIDVNLRDLYRVARKRKWIILFAPILMGLATFFFTQVPPPIYNAEALIKIMSPSPKENRTSTHITSPVDEL